MTERKIMTDGNTCLVDLLHEVERQRNEALLKVSELTIENILLSDQIVYLQDQVIGVEELEFILEDVVSAYQEISEKELQLGGLLEVAQSRGWEVTLVAPETLTELRNTHASYTDEITGLICLYS